MRTFTEGLGEIISNLGNRSSNSWVEADDKHQEAIKNGQALRAALLYTELHLKTIPLEALNLVTPTPLIPNRPDSILHLGIQILSLPLIPVFATNSAIEARIHRQG